jgi:hypothetical protein
MCMISHHLFCLQEDDVAFGKYRRYLMSYPFFCVREDDADSMEVQKVQDVTFLLLRERR